jgi:DNA-binding IclR family transcriptional regulator
LIQSVDRSARLLHAIATSRHPLSVAELADACGLNRSTTWRLLTTLEHHGLVERDDVSQRYAIGYGLVRLAAGKTDHAILIRLARPVLERIAAETEETVNLSIALPSGMVVCIDQVDSVPLVGVNWLDRPLPWHCTSAGKLHLAYLPPAEVEAYLARARLEAFTPRTITAPEGLRADGQLTRKQGYALALEEQEIGLNAASAGIFSDGGPVAVVSVSGPAFRLPATIIERIGRELVGAGEEIARRLAASRAGDPPHA